MWKNGIDCSIEIVGESDAIVDEREQQGGKRRAGIHVC
jgi:hypothetical protein